MALPLLIRFTSVVALLAAAHSPALAAGGGDIVQIATPQKVGALFESFRKAAAAEKLDGVGETRCSQLSTREPSAKPPKTARKIVNCEAKHACFGVSYLQGELSEVVYSLTGRRSEACTRELLASARKAFASTFVTCSDENGRKASIERLMTTDHTEYQRDPLAEWQPPSQTLVNSPINAARVDIAALCKTMSGHHRITQRGPDWITENVVLTPVAGNKQKGR